MIRKLIFILTIFFIFGVDTFAQEKIDISTVEPKLLWQKEFATPINSVAMSSDGTRIALTVNPVEQKINDERYILSGKEKLSWMGCSKLYYLDNKGNILWEYEYREEDPKKRWYPGKPFSYDGIRLTNVVMSGDGEYIACAVEDLYSYEAPYYGKGVELRQDRTISKVLFFNFRGNLLWVQDAKNVPTISSDGSCLLLIPEPNGSTSRVTLIDKNGRKIFSESPGLYNMSKDGNSIIVANTLYDRNGNVIWEYPDPYTVFTGISDDGLFGLGKKYSSKQNIYDDLWIEFFCFDFTKKEVLWKKEVAKDLGLRGIIDRTFIFEKDGKRYLISYAEPNIMYRPPGLIQIYDLITGEIVSSWSLKLKPITYLSFDELPFKILSTDDILLNFISKEIVPYSFFSHKSYIYGLFSGEFKQEFIEDICEISNTGQVVSRSNDLKSLYYYDASKVIK